MGNEILTFDEIRKRFPNEWILLGLDNVSLAAENKGTILFYSKDYLELCFKGSEIAKDILTKIFYTREEKQNRKWLKLTRLKEQPTTI